MTPAELRVLIEDRAKADPALAAMVEARLAGDVRKDVEIAATLPPSLVPRAYLITKRGLRRVLGKRDGRVFILALREAAALGRNLPEAHPAYDDLWWLGEILPDLEAGGAGVDIGDHETRAALRGLAALAPALGTPHAVTAVHCDALDAASSTSVPVSYADVSAALSLEA